MQTSKDMSFRVTLLDDAGKAIFCKQMSYRVFARGFRYKIRADVCRSASDATLEVLVSGNVVRTFHGIRDDVDTENEFINDFVFYSDTDEQVGQLLMDMAIFGRHHLLSSYWFRIDTYCDNERGDNCILSFDLHSVFMHGDIGMVSREAELDYARDNDQDPTQLQLEHLLCLLRIECGRGARADYLHIDHAYRFFPSFRALVKTIVLLKRWRKRQSMIRRLLHHHDIHEPGVLSIIVAPPKTAMVPAGLEPAAAGS